MLPLADDPETIGLSAGRLELIRRRGEEWTEQRDAHRTLVLLVARHGTIGFLEAFGVEGPEADASPVGTDAIFPLMSQTKPIVATMVNQLAEDGLVGLTRPVQDYLPEFVGERKDGVLVHHLLTHTSGIGADDDDFFSAAARLLPQMASSLDAALPGQHPFEHLFLELALAWPVAHPPGEMMRYCSINYFLLGEILRRVSGQSLDALARERLFGPLGMNDTSFGVPDERADRVVRRDFAEIPQERFVHSSEGRGSLGGAGGAYSTAVDLATFMQTFLDDGHGPDGCRVLHPSTVTRMTTDQVTGVPALFLGNELRAASMGLGWLVTDPEPTIDWPLPPDGSFLHGGTGLVCPWADPATGVVGVFCSVADRVRDGGPAQQGIPRHRADLFVNMVTAAVID